MRDKIPSMWLRDITPEHITWFWKPFLQSNAVNLCTGDPGVGKSTLVCDIVARLTTGRPLPGPGGAVQTQRAPLNCWIMNGEDAASDTISWRCNNQGADPNRTLITDTVHAITPEVAREVERIVAREQIGFICIDPIQAWMGAELDINRANEVRAWTTRLRDIAIRQKCCFLLLRHRRKSTGGEAASIYSGLGSIDATASIRSEISVTAGAGGLVYVQRIKGNVGITGDALAYTIKPHPSPDNEHGVLEWVPHGVEGLGIEIPAGRAGKGARTPKEPSRVPKALRDAERWLAAFLEAGPRSVIEIYEAAKPHGFSQTTLRRARENVAEARQDAKGHWTWCLIEKGGMGEVENLPL